ncbi:MAG TPA: hypothetical protein VGQ26_11320 [Streptosporangiaceae bacterium]|jgi:hypothetical protein|nr:hypothetical protein [Streptosporangiaceae bacterium]
MGAAFGRVIAALDTAGRQPRVYGSGKATAHCPGSGHYRGDQHPSLTIAPGDGCALVCCHALCDTADVLAAIGLSPADLFDEPRKPAQGRPSTKQLKAAIGKARGLSWADRYLYLWLLWLADWDTAEIPFPFQPRNQRALAAACGQGRMTIQQSSAHLALHGWLAISCGVKGCNREGPHRGRGHRIVYGFPGIGENCPGEGCRFRTRPEKAAQRSHLSVVGGASAMAVTTLLSVAGAGLPPPTTYLQPKPASDLRRSPPIAAFYQRRLQPFIPRSTS